MSSTSVLASGAGGYVHWGVIQISVANLVVIGDAFHNFIDGAIISTAVMTSIPLGVNTAIVAWSITAVLIALNAVLLFQSF